MVRVHLPMQEIWVWSLTPWVRKIPWRRKWQRTLLFLPGKSYGQSSLTGYSPWSHKRPTRFRDQTTTTLNPGRRFRWEAELRDYLLLNPRHTAFPLWTLVSSSKWGWWLCHGSFVKNNLSFACYYFPLLIILLILIWIFFSKCAPVRFTNCA